jgi:hypothetical protein
MTPRLPLVLAAVLAGTPAAAPRLLPSPSQAHCEAAARNVVLYHDGTLITGDSVVAGDRATGAARLVRVCETRTLRLKRHELSLDTSPIGDVSVTGWDRDYVEVVVRLTAAARAEGDALQLLADARIETEPTVRAVMRARQPRGGHRAWVAADFEVRAPRALALELTTRVGDIALTDVGGPVRARTTTGNVRVAVPAGVSETWGGLDAETATGAIDVALPAGLSAVVRARTTLGTVRADGLPFGAGACGGRACTGALGRGGATLRAVTATGAVVLRRR